MLNIPTHTECDKKTPHRVTVKAFN